MDFQRKNKIKERIETIESCSLMELEDVPDSLKPEENFEFLKQLFSDCSDFVMRKFKLKNSVLAIAIFVDGLIDTKVVNQALKSLTVSEDGSDDNRSDRRSVVACLTNSQS